MQGLEEFAGGGVEVRLQDAVGGLVGALGRGGTACSVLGQHQEGPEGLLSGMPAGQAFQAGDHGFVVAEVEVGPGQVLRGLQPEAFEIWPPVVFQTRAIDVAERGIAVQPQGRGEGIAGLVPHRGLGEAEALGALVLEELDVDLTASGVQPVADSFLAPDPETESSLQPGHAALHRPGRPARRLVDSP